MVGARLSRVSISSTSEEVQSHSTGGIIVVGRATFPLVQLPKKFKEPSAPVVVPQPEVFPLVQLPKKFKALQTSKWQ